MNYAPIALFAYNRLNHLKKTLASLQQNTLAKESDLFIFSDGPKTAANNEEVHALRQWLTTVDGFKSVTVIARDANMGLAASIIQGVTELLAQFSQVIVLEDDLILSPYFLQYMNDGLKLYEKDNKVASIHGYALPLKNAMPETYFLRGADCWGWATWQRAWQHFEKDGSTLLAKLQQQNLIKLFDFDHTQENTLMLKNQIAGLNNSWAIRWHASAFINNMLTLYPGKSLVNNIGLDNSGTHCHETDLFNVPVHQLPITVNRITLDENHIAYKAYVAYFKAARQSIVKRILRKVKAWFFSAASKQQPA